MSYRQERRDKKRMQDRALAGVMPLTRQLGEKLDCRPVSELPTIGERVLRPTRESYWPPETWAEMQDIWEGRIP